MVSVGGYTPANLTPEAPMKVLPSTLGVVIIVKLLGLILGEEPTPVGRQAHTH